MTDDELKRLFQSIYSRICCNEWFQYRNLTLFNRFPFSCSSPQFVYNLIWAPTKCIYIQYSSISYIIHSINLSNRTKKKKLAKIAILSTRSRNVLTAFSDTLFLHQLNSTTFINPTIFRLIRKIKSQITRSQHDSQEIREEKEHTKNWLAQRLRLVIWTHT